jgi:hypothetical protein
MKLLNSNSDKYLIQCIEIDLYDLLYRAHSNQWNPMKLTAETTDLLNKYEKSGVIKGTHSIGTNAKMKYLYVEIYASKLITIRCDMP